MKSWLKIHSVEIVVFVILLLMAWEFQVVLNHLFLFQRFLRPSLTKQQDLISRVRWTITLLRTSTVLKLIWFHRYKMQLVSMVFLDIPLGNC